MQNREQGDLILVFVIHYPINCYDNRAKNHCSERDPPRLRSEHKFHGIYLLINSYTAIYTYRKLSRPVPVFAQIGAVWRQTNQADSNKPNAIRQNQGVIFRIIVKSLKNSTVTLWLKRWFSPANINFFFQYCDYFSLKYDNKQFTAIDKYRQECSGAVFSVTKKTNV